MSGGRAAQQKVPLGIAVLTVSDTRSEADDVSGRYLCEQVRAEGHLLRGQRIVVDDLLRIRNALQVWVADPEVQVILSAGGTGFAHRDCTPEAALPLLDKQIPGFGELFRQLSVAEIGSAAIQSRALAGLARETLIFCLPGSPGACRLAWEKILREQLDATHKPCNFNSVLQGFSAS